MVKSLPDEDLIHALIIMLGLIGYYSFQSGPVLIIFAAVSFILLLIRNRDTFTSIKPMGGYANWITLFRLTILLFLGFNSDTISKPILALTGLFILLLDGLDGMVARRFNVSSNLGGKLDGETDALFVLVFSVINYQVNHLPIWILWPGILRYLYVITCFLVWKKIKEEPVSYLRKSIAVVIMAALLMPFILEQKYYLPILILATLAVSGSFAKSFYFQMKSNKSRQIN